MRSVRFRACSVVMQNCAELDASSLLTCYSDLNGHGVEPSIVSLEISARDLWPVFGDGVDSAPMNKTIVRLNDAAMTLATMLISRDEYRTMRAAILSTPS
eukprot:COSAG02_NODE_613_length_19522_cov_13.355249_3_plen_100_part_00